MSFARTVPFLSAALVLSGVVGASAADLGEPDLNAAPTMAPMPAYTRKWYIRADGGYSWYPTPSISLGDFDNHSTKSNGAWTVGGGIGQYYAWGFRGDITVDHMFDATSETNFDFGSSRLDFNSMVVLANLYYEFNRGDRFVPYIGAGLGYAHNETNSGTVVDGTGTSSFGGKSTDNFAVAAMAGVSWRLWGGRTMYVSGSSKDDEPVQVNTGNAVYLDFGYRFLYLGDAKTASFDADGTPGTEKLKEITAHQFRVGVRYDLN
ncbi:outer membrane protein [Hyphomicrobium sp.]|jgi:opacity protein-like surface antigen|uniref:outer membrane protein n=1 Tax=Hyphomicrobium sp. TaxID=82 RepID=UPI003567EC83